LTTKREVDEAERKKKEKKGRWDREGDPGKIKGRKLFHNGVAVVQPKKGKSSGDCSRQGGREVRIGGLAVVKKRPPLLEANKKQ